MAFKKTKTKKILSLLDFKKLSTEGKKSVSALAKRSSKRTVKKVKNKRSNDSSFAKMLSW